METVRIVTIDARPVPHTEAFAKYAGAFINVYCTELSEDDALALASRELAYAGWHIRSVESSILATSMDFAGTSDGRQYFEQALAEGMVLLIHAYAESPHGETIH